MTAHSLGADGAGSQLYDLCGQFEQVLLASLVPQSMFRTSGEGPDDSALATVGSEQTAAVFTQALCAALERAGGLGLGREMYAWLSEGQR